MFAFSPKHIPRCTPRLAPVVIVSRGASSVGSSSPLTVHRHAKSPLAEPWLEGQGKRFEHPNPKGGPNWLGREVPFPMNPTFSPPPPLKDSVRQEIYDQYIADPQKNNIRALSTAYGISIKRIDAILRLKGLEANWQKVKNNRFHPASHAYSAFVCAVSLQERKTLQNGFLQGMENILGVQEPQGSRKVAQVESREADAQDELEGNNKARDRYQRHFWEPIADGDDPIIRASIEQSRAAAQKDKLYLQQANSASIRPTDRDRSSTVIRASSDNRPPIVFKDVGAKFVDFDDRKNRLREAERRKRIRHKS